MANGGVQYTGVDDNDYPYDDPKCLLFVLDRMVWENAQPTCDDWCTYYNDQIDNAGEDTWGWRWTAHCYPAVMTSSKELAWVQTEMDELDMIYTWVGGLTTPESVLVDDDSDGFTQWSEFEHVPAGLYISPTGYSSYDDFQSASEPRATVLHHLICELRYFKTTPTTTTTTTTTTNATTSIYDETTIEPVTIKPTTAAFVSPLNVSGQYNIDGYGGSFQAYVDAESDDGPWIMVLAVEHDPVSPLGGSIDLETLPLSPNGSYSSALLHDYMPELAIDDVKDVRFFCRTSEHGRTLDFHTDNSFQREIAIHGGVEFNRVTAWTVDFVPMPNHSAFLPGSTDGVDVRYSLSDGEADISEFRPGFAHSRLFFDSGVSYFAVGAFSGGVEQFGCDGSLDSDNYHTVHRVFVSFANLSNVNFTYIVPVVPTTAPPMSTSYPPPIINVSYIYKVNELHVVPEMWAKPMLLGVDPPFVGMQGGEIQLIGVNLRNETQVYVGGFPCTDVRSPPSLSSDSEWDDRFLTCTVGYHKPGFHNIEIGLLPTPWSAGFYVNLYVALHEAINFVNMNPYTDATSTFFDTALWDWALQYKENCPTANEPTWYAPPTDPTYQTVEFCDQLLPSSYVEYASIDNPGIADLFSTYSVIPQTETVLVEFLESTETYSLHYDEVETLSSATTFNADVEPNAYGRCLATLCRRCRDGTYNEDGAGSCDSCPDDFGRSFCRLDVDTDDEESLNEVVLRQTGTTSNEPQPFNRRQLTTAVDQLEAIAAQRDYALRFGSSVPCGRPGWHRPAAFDDDNYSTFPFAQCTWPGYGCAVCNQCVQIWANGTVEIQGFPGSTSEDVDESHEWMCRACDPGFGFWWGSCYECAITQPPLLNLVAFLLVIGVFVAILFLFRCAVYKSSACAIADHEETMKRTQSLGKATLQKWKAAGNDENAVLRASSRKQAGQPGAAAKLFGDQAKDLANKGKAAVLKKLNQLQHSAFAGKMRKLGKSALQFAGEAGAWAKHVAECIRALCNKDVDPYRKKKSKMPIEVTPDLPPLKASVNTVVNKGGQTSQKLRFLCLDPDKRPRTLFVFANEQAGRIPKKSEKVRVDAQGNFVAVDRGPKRA